MPAARTPPAYAITEPLTARAVHRVQRARLRFEQVYDGLRSMATVDRPTVLGCYNTSNVGDRSFATVLTALADADRHPVRCASYGAVPSQQWKAPMLFGGGGLLNGQTNTPLTEALLEPRRDRSVPAAMVSISTSYGVAPLREPLAEQLAALRLLGVRDSATAAWLRQQLPGAAICEHPDIAFALPALSGWQRPTREAGLIGINLVPVLLGARSGVWRPKAAFSEAFMRAIPEVAALGTATAEAYLDATRNAVRALLQRGNRVVHIPFAIEDDGLARALFRGMDVTFAPFRASPHRVLTEVARCERLIATRFHAHVFALATQTPLLSLPYSDKCSLLLRDLGLPAPALELKDWAPQRDALTGWASASDVALALSDEALRDVVSRAQEASRCALRAVSGDAAGAGRQR